MGKKEQPDKFNHLGSHKQLIVWATLGMFLLTVILFLALIYLSGEADAVYEIDAIIYLITMILSVILLLWYNWGRYDTFQKTSRDYIVLLLCQYLAAAAGAVRALIRMHGEHVRLVTLTTLAIYLLNIAVMYFFGRFVYNYMEAPDRVKPWMIFCHRAAALLHLGIVFYFTAVERMTPPVPNGGLPPAVMGPVNPVFDMLWLLLIGICIILYVPKRTTRWSFLSYLVGIVPITLVYLLTYRQSAGIWLPSLLSFFGYLSLLIIFGNVYVERSRTVLDQQKQLREQENELIQSQLDSMLLQINPHFLYNTLGSVKSLCMTDPERAAGLVQDFSEYLQTKYANINGQQMVPIDSELDAVAMYLRIERVRFPNIRIEYDIMADDFEVPALSIQPLAENAVRHGIGQRRRNAGTLRISTWETAEAWQVCVEDDGAGFDTSAMVLDDGRRHLGLGNVETRLRLLCSGTLEIESTPGVGTRCVIAIPKKQDLPESRAGSSAETEEDSLQKQGRRLLKRITIKKESERL